MQSLGNWGKTGVDFVLSVPKVLKNLAIAMFLDCFLVQRLHSGEKEDVADGCGVGEEHHESVYAEAKAACGRQTVLEGGDIVVINLRLARGILCLSLCDLTLEAFSLVDGVVELGECVSEFGCVDEVLKTLGECGIFGLSLCKRAVFYGVIVDECGLDEVFLNECVEELNEDRTLCLYSGKLNVLFLCDSDCFLVGLDRVKVNTRILLYSLYHGHSFPLGEVDLLALIVNGESAADVHCYGLHHLLNKVHHAVVIGISLVKLDRGKLGVMLGVHTLVTEDTSNLVYLIHTADDESLEVELGLDTEDHIHIKGVVVGQEWASGCADLEGCEDGGVDLKEALGVEVSTELTHNEAALYKGILNLGIYDEVEVSLTVSCVGVLKSVELLGKRKEGLGEEGELLRVYRDLAAAGEEHKALDTDDITDIPLAVVGKYVLADVIDTDVALNSALSVRDVDEVCLTHIAAAHNTTCEGNSLAVKLLEVCLDISRISGNVILHDLEGILARLDQILELIASVFDLRGYIDLGGLYIFIIDNVSHFTCLSSYLFLVLSTLRISSSKLPEGASTVTVLPAFLPTSARPMGDISEILSSAGDASFEPTIT